MLAQAPLYLFRFAKNSTRRTQAQYIPEGHLKSDATCTTLTYNVQRVTFRIVSIRLAKDRGWTKRRKSNQRKQNSIAEQKYGKWLGKSFASFCGACIYELNFLNKKVFNYL